MGQHVRVAERSIVVLVTPTGVPLTFLRAIYMKEILQ